jgi:hypothetical protein
MINKCSNALFSSEKYVLCRGHKVQGEAEVMTTKMTETRGLQDNVFTNIKLVTVTSFSQLAHMHQLLPNIDITN